MALLKVVLLAFFPNFCLKDVSAFLFVDVHWEAIVGKNKNTKLAIGVDLPSVVLGFVVKQSLKQKKPNSFGNVDVPLNIIGRLCS